VSLYNLGGRWLKPMGAMRYSEYRKYWVATTASVLGFHMVMFAQLWLVRQLEENPIWLGAVGLATGAPAVLLTLFGGVIADKMDQRRLIMTTQTLLALLTVVLGLLTLLDIVQVWHILLIALLGGAIQAFDNPARMALFPHLVHRDELVNAVALTSSIWPMSRIIAPAITGIIIVIGSTEASLFTAGFGFFGMAIIISRLNIPPIPRSTGKSTMNDLLDGARFVRNNSIFASLITMSFFNSFFGLGYMQLMPVFTVDILQKGAAAQGSLVSAGGVGAFLGTISIAFLGRFPHQGWLIIVGSALFGAFIAGFGLSHWFNVSIVLLFLASFLQSIYLVSIISTLQMRVPDELRGRVMSIYGMTFNIMPIGGMFAGIVASIASAPIAVAIGGGAVSIFSVFSALTNRQVRHLARHEAPSTPAPGNSTIERNV
jgi:MFS family permease